MELALGVSDGENPDSKLTVIKGCLNCHKEQPVFYILKMHGDLFWEKCAIIWFIKGKLFKQCSNKISSIS